MTLLYMYLIPGIPLGINHVYPKGSPCAPFNIKIDYTKNIVLIHNVNAIDYWSKGSGFGNASFFNLKSGIGRGREQPV